MSAIMEGPLWMHNLARVVVLDVTDDYELMQPPLPNECYPVLQETWMPKHRLDTRLHDSSLVEGFLYDWHQTPEYEDECWYVGVVRQELAQTLLAASGIFDS